MFVETEELEVLLGGSVLFVFVETELTVVLLVCFDLD